MSYVDIDRAKARFLQQIEDKLKKKISRLQEKLFEILVLSFTDFLDREADVIKSTSNNLSAGIVVDKVFKEWTENDHLKVVQGMIADLQEVSKFNGRYFAEFETKPKFNKLKLNAQSYILKTLGVNTNGELIKGAFIDSLIKDTSVKNRVKQVFINAVTGKKSYKETLEVLKELITDTETSGLLQRHYKTYVYDTFQRYDRIEANFYAIELGYQAATYEGTKIPTTRSFCRKRAGEVFTRKEIGEFKTLEWGGKNDNYDPFTDQGGYNCRHRYRWIPNRLAIRKRNDLKIVKGNLVKK